MSKFPRQMAERVGDGYARREGGPRFRQARASAMRRFTSDCWAGVGSAVMVSMVTGIGAGMSTSPETGAEAPGWKSGQVADGVMRTPPSDSAIFAIFAQ